MTLEELIEAQVNELKTVCFEQLEAHRRDKERDERITELKGIVAALREAKKIADIKEKESKESESEDS